MNNQTYLDTKALIGDYITIDNEHTYFKICNFKKGELPIGIAARNIEMGEIIEYNPVMNTKDIIVNLTEK